MRLECDPSPQYGTNGCHYERAVIACPFTSCTTIRTKLNDLVRAGGCNYHCTASAKAASASPIAESAVRASFSRQIKLLIVHRCADVVLEDVDSFISTHRMEGEQDDRSWQITMTTSRPPQTSNPSHYHS
ncbi:hypothetical protein HYALB_00007248 [Hymenoscyphus albidus]|uniref:Uncharacterized protein n=1 Tax=Hymenoscyphus albidus TaxID=595503 RepID=A0A9N9Q4A7_9HELO|nr:hypothetical protein HYALB_00007248 [Hymenoscyphus albidus]